MGTERLFVGITSYDRPNMLSDLVNDIQAVTMDRFDLDVRIYDDGSDFDPTDLWFTRKDWITFNRHEHRGKEGFWRTMNQIVQDAEAARYDYLFILQDDLRLVDLFFDKAILTWEAISDPKKLALSTLLTPDREGRQLWNGIEPEIQEFEVSYLTNHGPPETARDRALNEISYGWGSTNPYIPVWRTDWVDCIWMSDGRFAHRMGGIAEVDGRRWEADPDKSSGVGAQITFWGNKLGWNFYQVAQSLVIHGDHESKMNPSSKRRLVTDGPTRSTQRAS